MCVLRLVFLVGMFKLSTVPRVAGLIAKRPVRLLRFYPPAVVSMDEELKSYE